MPELEPGEDVRLDARPHGVALVQPLLRPLALVGAGLVLIVVGQEYWVAAGWKLRKVFDQRTGSMDSSATGAATTTKVGKLTLAGGFPRRIELTEVTKHGGCEAHAGDAPCDDSEPSTSFTFVYDGAQYVRKK